MCGYNHADLNTIKNLIYSYLALKICGKHNKPPNKEPHVPAGLYSEQSLSDSSLSE